MSENQVIKPKQATIEVGEEKRKFVLQHPGARAAVAMRDRCKNKHGQLLEENYYTEIMKNVIMEPKVNYDYFDQEGNEDLFTPLMEQAIKFVNNDKTFRQSDL